MEKLSAKTCPWFPKGWELLRMLSFLSSVPDPLWPHLAWLHFQTIHPSIFPCTRLCPVQATFSHPGAFFIPQGELCVSGFADKPPPSLSSLANILPHPLPLPLPHHMKRGS